MRGNDDDGGRATGLTVAFAPDSPPYVMAGAGSGVEVDLIRRLLPDHPYDVVQMPYGELQAAVAAGRADVAVPVRADDDGVHYSRDFTVFHNVAVSKRAAALQIDDVADLKGRRVLTWENAYNELGDEFEGLYGPGAPQRRGYREIGDQREQVAAFWRGDDEVLVIDLNIFRHFSREMGHDVGDAVVHWIFAADTAFQVGFRDRELRDVFDRRLAELRDSGEYQRILDAYDFQLAARED